MADTRVEVVLGMPFLTLSNADIWFAEVLVWRTYTAADDQADGTLRSERISGYGPGGLW